MAPLLYTDSPLSVIQTPKFETGKTDPFTMEASHMALSHNAFIRGFNSIYQQALRIQAADKKDFVGYCVAWVDCVAQHHHYEETEFFPALDKAAGKEGLMTTAVDQHAAFHDGLEKFKSYLEDTGPKFSGQELITIMDSFKDPLHIHLKEEPPMIVGLSNFNTAETPIDIIGLALAAGKKQLSLSFLFNVLPVFFLNMESVNYENGLWHNVFPPVNGVAKWLMLKGAPMWHSRRWRNRKNRCPLPNVTLWDTMMIALLDYQLDEFMETILAKDEDMKQVEAFKCMVKQLCKFPDSEEQSLLDHLCGYNDSKIGVREMQESITSKLATANGSEKMSSNTYMEVSHDTMSKQGGIPEVHNMATEVRRSNESSDNSTRSDTLSRLETVLVRLTTDM